MTRLGTFVFAVVWALLVVFAVHFLDFPGSVPRFEKLSRGGVLLDASPAFTVDAVYRRLSDYGDEGRKSYAFRNVTVDIILPLSVLPFLFLLMHKAVTALQLTGILRVLLLSLSPGYVIFDFAENATILALLTNYPERMDLVAGILPYVTLVKRAASLLAFVVPLALFGIRFLRGRFHES
jgi:hypothetical protein